MATATAYQNAFIELFRECFEGVKPGEKWTLFVEGNEAIWNLFETLTADQASIAPGGASIGAHLNHACYYLHLMNAAARNQGEIPDWPGSWTHQTFTQEEWQALRKRFQAEYREANANFQGDVADQHIIIALAQLAHAAYHLGACRALARQVT